MSEIHRLMSFQEEASDVSRLNREAARAPIAVHPHTFRVLAWAARMAQLSRGLFDASVTSTLVEWGRTARPAGVTLRGCAASFRDIELRRAHQVFFKRPLWIDLGGIAKGYAVDRAIATLQACGISSACVNAGGDLRTVGAHTERVAIRTVATAVDILPMLEIRGGALATSAAASSRVHAARAASRTECSPSREALDARTTVSVLAGRCVIADALTKVVLADPSAAAPLLRRFRAVAHIHHPDYPGSGWRSVGMLS